MSKKLFVSLILIAPLFTYADEMPFSSDLKGIHILPLEKQNLSADMKKEILDKMAETKEKGYQETNGDNVQYLMNIKYNAPTQLKASSEKNYGDYDTRLKTSHKEIKLAFSFKGISGVSENDVIGYAAIGTFEKDGWNGIREIFYKTELGNCSYSYMKISAVELAKETTEYLVNEKPSNKLIEGNRNVGFLYTINWYTDNSMNILECANKLFDPKIMTKMVALANEIDSRN